MSGNEWGRERKRMPLIRREREREREREASMNDVRLTIISEILSWTNIKIKKVSLREKKQILIKWN